MATELPSYQEQTSNPSNLSAQEDAERRKKLREKIELREMAKSLNIDDNDWDAAFGD